MSGTEEQAGTTDEIERLRARVSELEAQLAEQSRTTNALVAQSQEKLYWLERWHVDLDAVMRKPGAIPLLDAVRSVRGVFRKLRNVKRRVSG